MASASTNRTIWTVAIVAVFLFLAWKLWPAIKKLLNGGSGGSSGSAGAVGGAASPYPFQENPYQSGTGNQASLGFGSGQGGGPSPGSLAATDPFSAFTNWLQLVLSGGQDNAALASSELGYNPDTGMDELAQLNAQGLQSSAYQNFDVNELAYSPSSAATNSSAYIDTISADQNLYLTSGGGGDAGGGGGDGGNVEGGGGGGY